MRGVTSDKCHCPNSPNTAPATKNESHDWSLSHMKRYLQCAEQQVSLSKLTKYCAWHAKWRSWLILVTYETLFTMRGATSVIVQTHQILRLAHKMTVVTDTRHIWNVIYNARNNRWHPPTSPNTAPATQIDSWNFHKNFSKTAETSFTMCDRSENDPTMIRPWNRHSATRLATEVTFHAHHEHFVLKNATFSRSGYHSELHRILRLPRKVTLQLHQILRLPRKTTLMINPRHTWNAIYNARSNKCHCPNSPNTAPATKNESHDWSVSHMKRYLQCAEQQVSLSKLTKYCAWNTKWLSWLILVTYETLFTMRGTTDGILQHHRILRLPRKLTLETFTKISRKLLKCHFQCGADPRMIRPWSENDPTMKPSLRNPPRNPGYCSRPPRAFCIEK